MPPQTMALMPATALRTTRGMEPAVLLTVRLSPTPTEQTTELAASATMARGGTGQPVSSTARQSANPTEPTTAATLASAPLGINGTGPPALRTAQGSPILTGPMEYLTASAMLPTAGILVFSSVLSIVVFSTTPQETLVRMPASVLRTSLGIALFQAAQETVRPLPTQPEYPTVLAVSAKPTIPGMLLSRPVS